MALAGVLASTAQRHALVNQHVVADLGSLADHHAHAVVDEEAPPDAGPRVDVDTSHGAGKLRDHARQRKPARAIQAVRQTVHQNGMKTGVAQDDFKYTARSRIAPEYGVDLLAHGAGHVVIIIAVLAAGMYYAVNVQIRGSFASAAL